MPWIVIEFPIAEELAEAGADALKFAGADGASEEWRKGITYVRGFWRDAPEKEARKAAEEALARLLDAGLLTETPPVTVAEMEDQDWLEGWKQYFSPIGISPRLAICPSWETFTPQPAQAVVTLDPGMAFGTGTHGTTYTCLRALADYCTPGMTVCDVGTGSGILAMAAAKLDAKEVIATDNDDLAIRVAQENAGVNGVAENIDFRESDLLAGVEGPFDLVIANILAPVIIELAPQLARVMKPGAIFISSGYILAQEESIRATLAAAGQKILARYEREGWVTLVSRG